MQENNFPSLLDHGCTSTDGRASTIVKTYPQCSSSAIHMLFLYPTVDVSFRQKSIYVPSENLLGSLVLSVLWTPVLVMRVPAKKGTLWEFAPHLHTNSVTHVQCQDCLWLIVPPNPSSSRVRILPSLSRHRACSPPP